MNETALTVIDKPQASAIVPMRDMQMMAQAMASSGLFGMKTPQQALALMLVAQAEGMHPATAARDYDIIQGRPAKKSEAMLRDFLRSGGKIEWKQLDDNAAEAVFAHPAGGAVQIRWDMQRAIQADLGKKEMWRKYPRQMLRSRCISEGIRTVCPLVTAGLYVPEEVIDMEPLPTPPQTQAPPRQQQQQAPAPPPPPPPQQDASNETDVLVEIESVSVKREGISKAGKPYKIYAIQTTSGLILETFSDTNAQLATDARDAGFPLLASWKVDVKFNTLTLTQLRQQTDDAPPPANDPLNTVPDSKMETYIEKVEGPKESTVNGKKVQAWAFITPEGRIGTFDAQVAAEANRYEGTGQRVEISYGMMGKHKVVSAIVGLGPTQEEMPY